MMYAKETVLLEIIRTTALLFEVALQAPKKIGIAIQTYCEQDVEVICDCPKDANTMATEFLNWVYLDAPKPEWVKEGPA